MIIRELKFVNGVVLALGAVIGVAVLVAAVVAGANLLRSTSADEVITLLRPAAGEARPDYLPDGTPVWVIGHEDGSASVISGFDTHTPMKIGKLLWWCEELRLLDNPHHGSHWDEFGTKIGGPAPSGLPTWQHHVQGNRLVLGARQAPAQITGGVRPQGLDRSRCFGPDGDVIFHTFPGWKLWTSPQAAIEARPTGWVLIEGVLTVDAGTGRMVLCAVGGCADAAEAAGIDTPPPNMEFGPLGRDRFIARVRDGALADLTRVVWRAPEE